MLLSSAQLPNSMILRIKKKKRKKNHKQKTAYLNPQAVNT
jgi:hypothetical protein